MRIACWIPKATSTHSEYVIHIAFSLQQWLQDRASLLCYTHIDCLVCSDLCCFFCGLFASVVTIDSVCSSDSNLAPSILTDSLLKQYKAGGGLFALQMVRYRSADKEQ